jgi:L-gulono-1,4-lactone dehydrogenase
LNKTLEEVLAQEEHYPLQQFFLLPWRWDYFAQHRREVDTPISRLALLYRLYWVVGMDVGLHIIVRLLVRLLPTDFTKLFFRRLLTLLVPRPWRVVDRSDRQLTMQHELFRHIEIEIFVRRSQLNAALAYVIEHLEKFAADERYVHHYPICVRKVLRDDTLISMTAGWEEPGYALSFISYAKPNERDGFFAMTQELATTLATRIDARPHWGKYNPLSPQELVRLYPEMKAFAALVQEIDPDGVFQNRWLRQILSK